MASIHLEGNDCEAAAHANDEALAISREMYRADTKAIGNLLKGLTSMAGIKTLAKDPAGAAKFNDEASALVRSHSDWHEIPG